jgi:hypothetical protein
MSNHGALGPHTQRRAWPSRPVVGLSNPPLPPFHAPLRLSKMMCPSLVRVPPSCVPIQQLQRKCLPSFLQCQSDPRPHPSLSLLMTLPTLHSISRSCPTSWPAFSLPHLPLRCPPALPCHGSCQCCLATRSCGWLVGRVWSSDGFALAIVILPTDLTLKLIGRQRNSTVLWAVGASAITNISFKPVSMDTGLMVANSLCPLELTLRFQRPLAVGLLIGRSLAFLTWCMSILPLVIVLLRGGFAKVLSLSIVPLATIGFLG